MCVNTLVCPAGPVFTHSAQVLLRWSCHYWNTVVGVLKDTESRPPKSTPRGRKRGGARLLTHWSPSEDSGSFSSLLEEARMALASAAACRQDLNAALDLYSKVKTPHAAWNQSQVGLNPIIP